MRIAISDLKTRLKIAKEILKYNDHNGQVMTCGNCGSTYIEKVMDNKNPTHYRAQYVCKNCGCYCMERQDWENEDD
jgi:superfamily II helicase